MEDLYKDEPELYKEWATWYYHINGQKTEIDESGHVRSRGKEDDPLIGGSTVYHTFARVPYEYLAWYCKETMKGFDKHQEGFSVTAWQQSLLKAIHRDEEKRQEEAQKTP